jgi:mRNA interferase MazF
MRRGEVYDAVFDPAEGSEQAGTRPAIIVSNDLINASSQVVIVVPCTTYRSGRRIYRSQVLIQAPDGGLDRDSVALGEQVRAFPNLAVKRFWQKPSTFMKTWCKCVSMLDNWKKLLNTPSDRVPNAW